MRDVTPIEKLILEKEAEDIGGMLLLILGEPGAGKTFALARMVEKDMENDRIPLWTGQKSCQWIIPAAQNLPVTLWMHESIEDYQFFTTGSKKDGIESQVVDIERKQDLDVKIESFEEPEEIVEDIDVNRINVYYIPGADQGEKEKYFFQKMNYKLAKALNEREYGDHITWNADEIQNIAPDKQKKPFYDLQMNLLPNEWEDFRKNGVSKRGTGHGYGEMNWKFYGVKCNGICYMQGGKIHSDHSQINQGIVNNMSRGEFVVNGFEAGEFEMPTSPKKAFGWIRDHEDVELKMKITSDIPDVRPQEVDVESWLDQSPFEKKHLDDMVSVGEADKELLPWTSREIRRKLSNRDLQGVKIQDKWLLSRTQLINDESVPIED